MTKMKRFSGRGFTLLELVIVLVVIGILSLLTVSNFSGAEDVRQRKEAQAATETVREALRYFVLANKRLPCPDFSKNGYEGDSSGTCTSGKELGWVPYYSIGLPVSESGRMAYGVFRLTGSDDLTTLTERTGDPEGTPGYRDLGDMIAALNKTPSTVNGSSQIFVSGVTAAGTSDCVAATSYYPAFVLIAPLTDRNSDGDIFDGVNTDLWATGHDCIASPLQPLASDYDDVVIAESPQTLVGWLTLHAN